MRRFKPIPALTERDRARVLARIAPPNEGGCQLWTGPPMTNGRGQVRIGADRFLAHRVAYTIAVGPIPDGLDIDHRCHVVLCCAPTHLRVVTQKQNVEHRLGPQVNSQSGVRGVLPITRRGVTRWRARVGHNGRVLDFGTFGTIAEAEASVIAARATLFTHDDADQWGNP